MPHFKCVGCRTRLHTAAGPADLVGDLCPRCGSLLEPVGALAEIVGFQSIKHRDSAADASPREAKLTQTPLEAERWLDDGGSVRPEAVAQAIALAPPNENP